ncbi:hypothetical protein HY750_00540 [Candidatus Kuenenbacteria bacterium]|nr:hypothetical protein [Candidatus Kuenenbacteria bacterium]
MENQLSIEYQSEIKDGEILSLENFFSILEIRTILKMGKKRKGDDKEILTEKDLKNLEEKLKKNFSFDKEEDWRVVWKIIQQHPDFHYAQKIAKKKDNKDYKITPETEKMKNIYFEFPRLLLALYFKNETGVDFRKLEEMAEKQKILKQYLIEQIRKFIKKIEEFERKLKKAKEEIKKEEIKEDDKEMNKDKKAIKAIILEREKLERENARERIDNSFVSMVFIKEELEEMFKKE